MQDETVPDASQALAEELRRNNELLALLARNQTNWKLQLRQGLITGFGTAIGATVLISLLLWIIQPLKQLEVLKPTLDRIAGELERRPGR